MEYQKDWIHIQVLGHFKWLGIILVFSAVLFLPAVAVHAQIADVVHTSVTISPKSVKQGSSAVLVVRIAVASGYHIQSAHPYDHFLVATQVRALPVSGITFGHPEYPTGKDIPASKLITSVGKLSVYEGVVEIKIPLQVAVRTAIGPRELRVKLQTQACDANSCFMPQSIVLMRMMSIVSGQSSVPIRSTFLHPTSGSSTGEPVVRFYVPMSDKTVQSIWMLAIFALVGGLILNVMPCVLPVIPLKVLSLITQSHGDKKAAIRHGLVFALGIISLFVLLGLMIGGYQWVTGQAFVYGSQFQNPLFMLAIGLGLVAFGLSTLGVWTIQAPRAISNINVHKPGYMGAFSMGLLATILATPCSAPFLGSLLAWALLEPTWVVVVFFGLIGVGMATPYVVLAAMPNLLKWVPRAGRWADIIKNALGFVILGVAIFIFSSLPGRVEILAAVSLSLIVAAVCWVWGQLVTIDMPARKIWSIRGLAVLLGVLVGMGLWHWYVDHPESSIAKDDVKSLVSSNIGTGGRGVNSNIAVNRWEPFSEYRLHAALKYNHPVIIDFTAGWCINCRAVKAFVLDSPKVRKVFGQTGAVLLTADLTQSNPAAQSLLLQLGGRSIPFLAIISPLHPYHPHVLRDLYTIDDVLHVVNKAASK